jgi:hypothetical protein
MKHILVFLITGCTCTEKNVRLQRFCLVLVIATLLSAQFFHTTAHATSAAFSLVSAAAGTDGDYQSQNIGPFNSGLSLSLSHPWEFGSSSYYRGYGEAYVTTDIGRSILTGSTYYAGSITGSGLAHIDGGNPQNNAPHSMASSSGSVYLYYTPVLIKAIPAGKPQAGAISIPIIFSASGDLSISSSFVSKPTGFGSIAYGTGNVSVYTNAPGFNNANSFRAELQYANTATNSFSATTQLQTTYNTEYYVRLLGSANVHAWGGTEACGTASVCGLPSTAEYSFAVDPTFTFDQAAFDTLYGSNSFSLNEYFALEFSPNMPVQPVVPIPSTLLLLGSGFAGLVGYARKRLNK